MGGLIRVGSMMNDSHKEAIEATFLIPIGTGVSGGLITLPLWVQQLSDTAQVLSPIFGVFVGALTIFILLRKIIRDER